MRRFASQIGLLVIALVVTLGLAGPAAASPSSESQEWEFVTAINAARVAAGRAPLPVHAPLRDLARSHSARMGAEVRLHHNPTLAGDIEAIARDWQRGGENVGRGSEVPSLHKAFMDSAPHKANLLGDYNYMGVGVVHANGFLWVTAVFLKAPAGKPTIGQPAPPPPPPPAPPVPVTRIAGAADADTPVAVAQRFPAGQSDTVVVARSDVFADALAGSPLAIAGKGPVLLLSPGGNPGPAVAEAARVLRPGGTVYLIGGTGALGAPVADAFAGAGLRVERIAGADRYATAIEIARRVSGAPKHVLLVSGTDFADAVVAAPAAGLNGAPIVLASPEGLPAATRAYLASVPTASRTVIGGMAAVNAGAMAQAGATERIAGVDRYDTAVKVAERFFAGATQLSFATGSTFQDALAGSALSARSGMPLVLVSSTPPAGTRDFVRTKLGGGLEGSTVYGSASVVPDGTISQLFS